MERIAEPSPEPHRFLSDTLAPWTVPLIDPETGDTCNFQFWSFEGRYFAGADLPAQVEVREGENHQATAWFLCRPDKCPEGGCGSGFATGVYGIDVSTHTWVSESVLKDVQPEEAQGLPGSGLCPHQNPCATVLNKEVESLTAKGEADGLEFLGWLGHPAGERSIETPSAGIQIAFYADPHNPEGCRGRRELAIGERCVPLDELFLDAINLRWVEWSVTTEFLDPICRYVLDCPGCGPNGLCDPWDFYFQDEGAYNIRLHNILTGKVVGEAKKIGGGVQVLNFTPDAQLLDGGYVLEFQSLRKGEGSTDIRVPMAVKVASPK